MQKTRVSFYLYNFRYSFETGTVSAQTGDWLLKGTPVPVARHAGSNFLAGWQVEFVLVRLAGRNGIGCLSRPGRRASTRGSGAGAMATSSSMTGSALLEAVVACAGGGGARVKVAVLVEGEDGAGVPVAKDVATLAAVVSAVEVVEGTLASSVVANGGFCVGLLFVWR